MYNTKIAKLFSGTENRTPPVSAGGAERYQVSSKAIRAARTASSLVC